MKSFIEFPYMGLKFNLDRVAFYIGGAPVYWYGIIIGIGVLLGSWAASAVAQKKQLPKDTVLDVVLFGLPVSVICARLYYVIFEWEYYSRNLSDVFNIRNGGIAIYGAIIGGFITALVYCKVKKVNFPKLLDCASFGLLIGQIIGRWGNFTNQEAFGGNTTLPWAMTGSEIAEKLERMEQQGVAVSSKLPVHPTFLYESLWNIAVLAVIWFVFRKKHKFDGMEFCTYIALYGLGRFWIEGLRTDSLMLGPVRISQLVALLCVAVGVVLIVYNIKKKNNNKIVQNFCE
ncbi:MAG: prolipoprotein diacylglyceryl transferase [Clostridia bacterium]|nr:prolipoprotein diacylglyceryl transferase [Clostridia bacterium]